MHDDLPICVYCGARLDRAKQHTDAFVTAVYLSDTKITARLYKVWCNMKERCYRRNHHNYRWYGAKGVKICDDWLNYPRFRRWAVDSGYAPGLVIDRIDSDGDYKPTNCRWVLSEDNQPRRKLSRDDVISIRRSSRTDKELAERYSVAPSHINRIRS